MLLKPRNEAEFVQELKSWFMSENKGRAYFQMTGGASGLPDFVFGMIRPDGTKHQFYAEAKYVRHMPNTMRGVVDLMRAIQKVICMRMAVAGFTVFLIVCVDGAECLWYLFDPGMSRSALEGKCPHFQALYLKHVGRRTKQGKWELGEPADEKR